MRKILSESPTLEAGRSAAALAAPVVAVLLGAFVLIGAGFAPIAAIHNAAHDSRHSFAFPCH
jgi:cobalt transporter subunit CbtB